MVNTRLNEYSIKQLLTRSGADLVSALTRYYSDERKEPPYNMKDTPRYTKIVDLKLDPQNDTATFYFLVAATPKGEGSDAEHSLPADQRTDMEPKFSVRPDQNMAMERNPSNLYEVHLMFMNISDAFKGEVNEPVRKSRAKPKPLDLKQTPVQTVAPPEYKPTEPEAEVKPDVTVDTQPKSQGIAKDAGLVPKKQPIATTPMAKPEVKPVTPEQPEEEEEETNPPTFHEARTSLAQIKEWLLNADFKIWSTSPAFQYQGFNHEFTKMDAAIYPETRPRTAGPVGWADRHGNAILDKHLLEIFVMYKYFINIMAGQLANRWRSQNTKKESIQEREDKSIELWMSFAEGRVRIFKVEKLGEKFISPKLLVSWNRDQIVKKTKKGMSPILTNDDLTSWIIKELKNTNQADSYQDACSKASQIVLSVYTDTDFKGIFKTESITTSNPKSADVRISVPSGDVIYANGAKLMKEDIMTSSPVPVMWETDKYGDGFRFTIGEDKFSAWFEEDSQELMTTLMDYDSKSDEFEYDFENDYSWKQREYAYNLLKEIKDVAFYFGDDGADVESATGLTGKGNVGSIFRTIVDNVVKYVEKTDVPILSFQANSDSKSRPTLYSRIAKAIIAKTHNYVLEVAVNRYFNLYQFFCIRKDVYDRLFDAKLEEAEKPEGMGGEQKEPEPKSKEGQKPEGSLDNKEGSSEEDSTPSKKLVCTIGAFTPITGEHISLLRKVEATSKKLNAPAIVFISNNTDFPSDAVTIKTKAGLIKAVYPTIKICSDEDANHNIHSAMVWAYDRGFNDIYLIVGSDQVQRCTEILDYYNGKSSTAGKFDFKAYKVASYGDISPDSSEDAIQARNAVYNNDYVTFTKKCTVFQKCGTRCHSLLKNLFGIMRQELESEAGV